MTKSKFPDLGTIIIVIVSFIMVGYSFYGFYHDLITLRFKVTNCMIERSTIRDFRTKGKSGNPSSQYFTPDVKYSYKVNGLTYESTRYYILDTFNFSSYSDTIYDMVTQYPEKNISKCYYHPGNPKIAVLKKDKSFITYSILLIIGLIGIFSMLVPKTFEKYKKQVGKMIAPYTKKIINIFLKRSK